MITNTQDIPVSKERFGVAFWVEVGLCLLLAAWVAARGGFRPGFDDVSSSFEKTEVVEHIDVGP